MKPIWKASEHVEGPNDSDMYTAAIDITEMSGYYVQGKRSVQTHWNAVEFHDQSHETAVLKRDAVLELVWASGMVSKS